MATLAGKDLAWSQMEKHGWSKGQGLGRHSQGMVDALKPKLKFDQAGIGHNRAEEFEFHWWDHVFNKAAKGITVDDSGGDVRVEFTADKSEVSTKKLRRRMQKEMKSKLYSHFVKSGTLMGGNFTKEAEEGFLEEEKDHSKIRDLTDEELVKACGGRTAHKGARHGQKMSGKLRRIEEAEQQFLEQMRLKALSNHSTAPPPPGTATANHIEASADAVPAGFNPSTEGDDNPSVKKAKKRKKQEQDVDSVSAIADDDSSIPSERKKKKSKNLPFSEVPSDCAKLSEIVTEDENIIGHKEKKRKKCNDLSSEGPSEIKFVAVDAVVTDLDSLKKRKKKKKKNSASNEEILDSVATSEVTTESTNSTETVDISDTNGCELKKKKKKRKNKHKENDEF